MRSLKTGLAVAALMLGTSALTSPAFASGNNNQCYNNCGGGGDTTNNYETTNNNQTYNKGGTGVGIGIGKGGQGGQGGQGGTAFGGKVEDSGNSYNHIDNKNYNTNKIEDSANNHNYNSDYNNNSNKQGQAQAQKQGQGQGQEQEVSDSGNSSVNINNERPPVSTAYAAPLAAGEDTCMGSSSIGGQGVGFGLSIGTTWTDDNCRHLKNSRQLVALGFHRAATALMCVDEDVKNAMAAAGTPCPGTQQAAAAVAAPAVYAQQQMPPARTYAAPAPVAAPVREREYVPMAPIPDEPARKH
jgi:hypothetical protein